jgi:hypothetical protein
MISRVQQIGIVIWKISSPKHPHEVCMFQVWHPAWFCAICSSCSAILTLTCSAWQNKIFHLAHSGSFPPGLEFEPVLGGSHFFVIITVLGAHNHFKEPLRFSLLKRRRKDLDNLQGFQIFGKKILYGF